MDDQKRQTLILIESTCRWLSDKDAGHQLVLLAADYIDVQDLLYARKILAKIPWQYYSNFMIADLSSTPIRLAMAKIIEAFGLEYQLLKDTDETN